MGQTVAKKDVKYKIEFKWKNPVNPKESTYAFKQREVEIKIRKKDVDADFWLIMYTKDFKKTYKQACKCDWNLWRDEDDDEDEKAGMGDFGMGGGPTYESDDDSDSDDDDIPELEGTDDAKKTEDKTEKKGGCCGSSDKKEETPAPKETKAEDSLPP